MNNLSEREFLQEIGRRFRLFRLAKRMTQDDVSKITGVSRSDISSFESRGEKISGITILRKLAEAVGRNLEDLFVGDVPVLQELKKKESEVTVEVRTYKGPPQQIMQVMETLQAAQSAPAQPALPRPKSDMILMQESVEASTNRLTQAISNANGEFAQENPAVWKQIKDAFLEVKTLLPLIWQAVKEGVDESARREMAQPGSEFIPGWRPTESRANAPVQQHPCNSNGQAEPQHG